MNDISVYPRSVCAGPGLLAGFAPDEDEFRMA